MTTITQIFHDGAWRGASDPIWTDDWNFEDEVRLRTDDGISLRHDRWNSEQEDADEEPDMQAYFDDLEGHIEMLEIELDITEADSEHHDALAERIEYLKARMMAGDAWVDNDITASPDAWKTLATFTKEEAVKQAKIWDEV